MRRTKLLCRISLLSSIGIISGFLFVVAVLLALPSTVWASDPLFDTRIDHRVCWEPYSVFSADLDGDTDYDLAVACVAADSVSILMNNGDGTFQAPVNYYATDSPQAVAAGDLDGDTDPDLVVPVTMSNKVLVFKNNGNGTFQAPSEYGVSWVPRAVYVADLDGDLDQDLAVTAENGTNDYIAVLRNNGNGTFQGAAYYTVGNGPTSVVAVDLDGDDDNDLAIVNSISSDVSVLMNYGDGTFQSAAHYSVYSGLQGIAATDLDGDTDIDLAVAGPGIAILVNEGNGTFIEIRYPSVESATSLVTTDLDDDFDYDIAAAVEGTDDVLILINDGGGAFESAGKYCVGDQPQSIFSADFDDDSDNDLVIANRYTTNVSILKNNGDGTFPPDIKYATGTFPWSVCSADLDGDFDKEVVTANTSSANVSVLENFGDGTLGTQVNYSVGSGPKSVIAADLDADSDYDLATANSSSNDISVLENLIGGSFGSVATYSVAGPPECVFAADLDGDLDLDLISANSSADNISVLMNESDGTFATAVNYPAGDNPVSIYAADFDGDTDRDLAVACSDWDSIAVLINVEDGQFGDPVRYFVGDYNVSVYAADIDGDYDNDLAVANALTDKIMVLENNGDGTFQTAVGYAAAENPLCVILVDMDGDGYRDIVASHHYSHNVVVLTNNGDGTFQPAVQYGAGHGTTAVCATDINNDGNYDLVTTNSWQDSVCVLTNLMPASYVCGDANNNDVVALNDATYIVSYIFLGGPVPHPYIAGNADGCSGEGSVVNVADAAIIIDYLFGDVLDVEDCQITSECALWGGGNEVQIGSPPYYQYPGGDSVAIPIYITNVDTIKALSLGFKYTFQDSIEILSVDWTGGIGQTMGSYFGKFSVADHEVLVGALHSSGTCLAPQSGGLLVKLNAKILMGLPTQQITLDTSFVSPGGDFLFAKKRGGIVVPTLVQPAPAVPPVTTLADAGVGSLRAAIEAARSAESVDTIRFEVSGTINLQTPLPEFDGNGGAILDQGVVILGATAPGGVHSVILDGSALSNGDGLVINSNYCGSSKIDGLVIRNFPGNGVTVVEYDPPVWHVIANNLIYGNGGLAIDIGDNGVSQNDWPDDFAILNFPEIDSVRYDGVAFTAFGQASDTGIVIDFYVAQPSGDDTKPEDPSGHGEAYYYIGSATSSASLLKGREVNSFEFEFPDTLAQYTKITMMSTAFYYWPVGTSEFSENFTLTPSPLIIKAISQPGGKRTPPSVVNLWITDPNGDYIGRDAVGNLSQTLFPADYDQESPLYDDSVTIHYPLLGEYTIEVIAESGAEEGDMYSVNVRIDGSQEVVLADDIQVPLGASPPDTIAYVVEEGCDYINGDADGSGGDPAIDIDDVVFLINYVFASGTAPDPLEAGDADCSLFIDIDDIVYLIGYIFAGSAPPCQD